MDNEKELRTVLSKNIKRYRNRLGLSQLNLALHIGISANFLCDIESGKKWTSPNTLIKLAKILRIEVYELFKPEETIVNDTSIILSRCLDDASFSVKQIVEQSINQSFENIRAHYLGTN
ncbi:MAG: helix-turn-helix domain-containing protein [Treponema sp.]|jgi:transcriptional regulator with XRE-family HTH domain|nr:helix-turn-helix domain-containing protein [Treponema sp.]